MFNSFFFGFIIKRIAIHYIFMSNLTSDMEIQGVQINESQPPYIIAEISCNHVYKTSGEWGPAGKSYERCEQLLRLAAEAGCHAVKLQTYLPNTITVKSEKPPFQIKGAAIEQWNDQTLYDLYEENYTPWEWTPKLMKVANELGITLFTSPFDETAVDFLEECGVPAYKIASFESTDHGLLRKVASTGKPIILSTGMSSEEDIDESITVLREAGATQIAVLRCTSAYPAKHSDAHISAIPYIAKKWNVVSGLSDHTTGISIALGAVALGARIIEKHIVLDPTHPTADAPFSMTPQQFKELVIQSRIIHSSIGDPNRAFLPKDGEVFCKQHRRSLFVVKDMKRGDVFIDGVNVRSIRPSNGLHTRFLPDVVGKAASVDIERGTPLSFELVQPVQRPKINIDTLLFHALEEKDIFNIMHLRNNNTDILRQSSILTEEDQKIWWAESSERDILYSIYADDNFFGYGGFVHIDHNRAEISFLVHDCENYTSIQLRFFEFLRKEAFRKHEFDTIWTETFLLEHRKNHIKTIEDVGFVKTHTNEKSVFHEMHKTTKNILITGAAGCIGKELVKLLYEEGANIHAVDVAMEPDWDMNIVYHQMDANNLTHSMLAPFKITEIYHLAASFERSTESDEFLKSNFWHNVKLSHHITKLAKEMQVKRVVFASSYLIYNSSLYKESKYAIDEQTEINPRNICGVAKLMHEMELAFCDIPFIAARIFRLYGKGDRCIISRWVRAALRGEILNLYGEHSCFDYISDKDAAKALFLLAKTSHIGIVNVGSGISTPISEIANYISKTLCVDINRIPCEKSHLSEFSRANISKLSILTGWKPRTSIYQGIDDLINYEKTNCATKSPTINILITSINSKYELMAHCNGLACVNKTYVADCNENCPVAHISSNFWKMPTFSEANAMQDIDDFVQANNISLIIPTRDASLSFWSKAANQLSVRCMVSPLKTTELCNDKLAFYRFCKENDMTCIPTFTSVEDVTTDRIVIRERVGAGSRNYAIGINKAESQKHVQNMLDPVFSPYVEGREYTVDFYVNMQNELVSVVPRTRDVVIDGESCVTTTEQNQKIWDFVQIFVKKLHFWGHINLQLFENDSGYHIIECNPRIGGASLVSLKAGCKSIQWAVQETLGKNIPVQIGQYINKLQRVCCKVGKYSNNPDEPMPKIYTYCKE